MSTIVIVDDATNFRDEVEQALRSCGHQTVSAGDEESALDLIRQRRPDLVLLDVGINEMAGFDLLRTVRNDPSLPQHVIVVTGVAERNHVLRAAELGVRDYLLKPEFSLRALLERVERLLSRIREQESPPRAAIHGPSAPVHGDDSARPEPTSKELAAPANDDPRPSGGRTPAEALKSLRPLLTQADVVKRLSQCEELKAFSPTVTKLMKLTQSEGSSVGQISRAIMQDQALALKILKLSNSAVYTRGEPVETVEKAVVRIGLSQIRQVILNVSVIDNFSSVSIGASIEAGPFWEHAIGCGLIAAEIAHARGPEEADHAFTMGLMHDVGRVILAQAFPDEYLTLLNTAADLQLPLEQVEKRLLTQNHADCMDRILHAWKFPKNLIDPIVLHHLSVDNVRRTAPRRLAEVATLALANRLSHALCMGHSGNEMIYPTAGFCDVLKLEPEVIQRVEETAREQTEALKLALLASSSNAGWDDRREHYRTKLARPLRPLFVSEKAHFDAFRVFCDQLAEGHENPTVGIVHLTDARGVRRLSEEYATLESEAGGDVLPLIILSPTGELRLTDDVMNGRRSQLLPTPVAAVRLIDVINHASAEVPSRIAA